MDLTLCKIFMNLCPYMRIKVMLIKKEFNRKVPKKIPSNSASIIHTEKSATFTEDSVSDTRLILKVPFCWLLLSTSNQSRAFLHFKEKIIHKKKKKREKKKKNSRKIKLLSSPTDKKKNYLNYQKRFHTYEIYPNNYHPWTCLPLTPSLNIDRV